MHATHLIDSYLRGRSTGFLIAVSLALVPAIGAVDYRTGYDLSLGVFYLVPVAIASWYVGRASGLVLSVASGVTWLLANALTSRGLGLPLELVTWNAMTRFLFFLIVSVLLSALATSFEHERALARTDHLTGVANSRAFQDLATRELARSRRRRLPISLVYLDLDHFKEVNDRYGHGEGDALLERLGTALRSHLRTTDVIGRLGGDEFAVLLPETGPEVAREVAEKVREVVEGAMAAGRWPVTVSVGVVTCVDAEVDAAQMIRAADRLMYEAKGAGRGGMRFGSLGAGSPETSGD